MTKVAILEIGEVPRKTFFLELKNLMETHAMLNADRNVFLIGKEISTSIVPIDNSVDTKDIKQELKQLKLDTVSGDNDSKKKPSMLSTLFSPPKKTAERVFIVEQEAKQTDHKLYPMRVIVANEVMESYTRFISLMNLKGTMLIDDSFYSQLYYDDYVVVDYGASSITKYVCKDRKLLDVTEVAYGMDMLLKKLQIEGDARYEFDTTVLNALSVDARGTYESSVRIHNTNIENNVNYVTGGGAIMPTIRTEGGRKVFNMTDKVKSSLTNKTLPEPLLRYLETMILAGTLIAKGEPIFNYLGNTKEIELPILNKVTANRHKLVAISVICGAMLLVLTSSLMLSRGLYTSGAYNSTMADVPEQLPYVLTSMGRVDKIAPRDYSVELEELDALYDEASSKIMAVDDLNKLSYQGTMFNDILERTNTITSANLVTINKVSEERVNYSFRGNIGDIPKVEEILKLHYPTVEYKVNHIDDLKSFSVVNFEFDCYVK